MKKAEVPNKVTEILDSLATPIPSNSKTQILIDIDARIGPLSSPSKMPGYAWGISAQRCVTGSKLAKIAGTSCSVCYAKKGRNRFPIVQAAQERRFVGWRDDQDWTDLMTVRVMLHADKEPYFRWFDSGDLQKYSMLDDINLIAWRTPKVKHWLPTQERGIVADYLSPIAPNLLIRISSTKIDVTQHLFYQNTSSVGKTIDQQEVHVCPSRQQDNKCGACRACWEPKVPHVRYLAH